MDKALEFEENFFFNQHVTFFFVCRAAHALAKKAGLPNYKHDTKILKRSDRDKLDAKACPDCEQVSLFYTAKHVRVLTA